MLPRPSRALLAAALIAMAGGLSACASGAPAAVSSSSATASGAASATPAAAATVPVTSTSSSGTPRLMVQISVGGGAPFTVMLDTGSTGLFVDESVVGPAVTSTGASYTEKYVDSSLQASLVQATVSIGGVATAQPITLGLIDSSSASGLTSGAQGIMGVAPADGDWQSSGLLSPLVQLAAPYNEGFQLDVPASGSGTLALGKPVAGQGTVSTPLTALSSPPANVPGARFWDKDVNLCWTIASLPQACGPTDLDTGAPASLLNSSVVTDVASKDGILEPGQPIAVATPDGAALWSFQTGTTLGQDVATLEALGAETSYNTGIAFYFGHVVGFDWADGQLLVTAK